MNPFYFNSLDNPGYRDSKELLSSTARIEPLRSKSARGMGNVVLHLGNYALSRLKGYLFYRSYFTSLEIVDNQ